MSTPEPELIPELINSPLSQVVIVEEHEFHIEIYQLEGEADWGLEVVNAQGTSFVWDSFPSDKEALSTALAELKESDIQEFLG